MQDAAPTFADTDPLVLDLTGAGIGVTNWISNDVYFDTNVVTDPNNPGKLMADGQEHHTSWVTSNDGILVFEPNGTPAPITNITQTISGFFGGNNFVDGFAALASLAQPGAALFSAATALIDPKTGLSYFEEVMVWQDSNGDGVSQPNELYSLASLGITSISLVGSPDTGQTINGSEVLSQATYTTANGEPGDRGNGRHGGGRRAEQRTGPDRLVRQ